MTLMRSKDSRPWGLIIALSLVAVVYVASLPLQVATYRNSQAVLRSGVEQNTRLVEQVRMLEEVGIRDVREHRDANQHDHDAQCKMDQAQNRKLGLLVEPCGSESQGR